jgi:hypothetical protein
LQDVFSILFIVLILSKCAASGVCRKSRGVFISATSVFALKSKTRASYDTRVNKNWSAPSSENHAKDSRHEFTTEKIHPSALPVTKGHALEAVTLDLHRQA